MPDHILGQNNGLDYTLSCVAHILGDLDTPFAKRIMCLLQSGRLEDVHAALMEEMPEASSYGDAETFRRDYLAMNLLRKSDFDLGVDREAVAVKAFLDSEDSCAVFNALGKTFSEVGPTIRGDSLEALFHNARGLVHNVLGEFSWTQCEKHIGFSSGASTRLKRKTGSPFYKFLGIPDVTPACAGLAISDIASVPLWHSEMYRRGATHPKQWVNLVAGSHATTVPKNWKTDRFICVEPEANMRLQRGVGEGIRALLRKKCGIDLSSQVLNQRLAWIGSRTGSLSTIDLKAASDSISLRLVEELVPRSWYEAILKTRSHYTFLEGKWIKLEKVSSMGNGFTFELETLIFWALSKSVLQTLQVEDQRLAVYGDDIVIHNSAAPRLIELLAYVGFQTNKDKTFVTGPFRESCGKHYFYGVDVSPFNIKSKVDSEDRFYWLMNSYNEWIRRAGYEYPKGAKWLYRSGRKFAKRYCIVPPGFGYDSGIETPEDRANVVWSVRKQAYLFKRIRAVRIIHRPNGPSALLWFLSIPASDPMETGILELHKGDAVYKRFNASTSRWGHFGP